MRYDPYKAYNGIPPVKLR